MNYLGFLQNAPGHLLGQWKEGTQRVSEPQLLSLGCLWFRYGQDRGRLGICKMHLHPYFQYYFPKPSEILSI